MGTTSGETRDVQRAFVGLLAKPLVTPDTDAELYRLVVRRLQPVKESAQRLGYRVQRVGRAVRLVRVPVAGTVTFPPVPADVVSRRVRSLACCLAACCEETSGTVTLQKLSDMVRDLIAAPGVQVAPYDPEERPQRKLLRDAARLLEEFGVLCRRTSDESLLDEWTESGQGVGAGYAVDRDAVLLLTSPDVLELAFATEPAGEEQWMATRTIRQLRALIETPVVLYADLSDDDAIALRTRRGPRSHDVAAMTGGHIEARSEGLLVVLTDDERPATVVDWPRARAADWVALLMADIAGRHGARQSDGTVTLTSIQVDEVVDDLVTWRGEYMNSAQKQAPGTIRHNAQKQLVELGLLRVAHDDSWTLLPVAARYRDPDITITTPAETPR
ncbi:TIGR02678 family protein [Micromonospora aurantiaca]|uniref:TIGR02678 family protein n=1 Tax=Micromonospora aurantiaca (nom. illeg.) TaxID=47850 RepID=UPI00119F8E79|nr:TIGR02678 family protein [Micromonospora aurantiaca]UFN96262.1 TIGR02678 family protein [Micromonospora aurantiaca]